MYPGYPPMPSAPMPIVRSIRWWLAAAVAGAVVLATVLLALLGTIVSSIAAVVLVVASLVGVCVCFLLAQRHPDARAVGVGLVWCPPLIGIVALVALLNSSY